MINFNGLICEIVFIWAQFSFLFDSLYVIKYARLIARWMQHTDHDNDNNKITASRSHSFLYILVHAIFLFVGQKKNYKNISSNSNEKKNNIYMC